MNDAAGTPAGEPARHGEDERIAEFRRTIAAMNIKDPAGARDSGLIRLGAGMMFGGVVLAIVAFFVGRAADTPEARTDCVILALAALTVAVVGTGLWLRFSLAGFFKFWLARVLHHQRTGE